MSGDFADQPQGSYVGLRPGSRIAGYLLEEQIGQGGMAVVFRARDEVLGRNVAVKIIAPALANDEEFRARFLRESRTVAAVDSLHIIPVYAAGEADGMLYIVTRFVAGGDLSALLRRAGGTMAADRTASLVAQVASALDAAHAAGLVHRDVKPQNILVDNVPERPEHAFLSDFGLSKGTHSSTALTVSGQFLGTPDYCAPEQIKGGYVDGRSDQYSLACVAFVLLTGALPFHRAETVATMYAHLQDPVPLVTRFRPDLPVAVNGVIARALAKSPADRYARCADFADALRAALVPVRQAPAPAPAFAPAPDPWAWLAKDGGRGTAGQPAWVPASQRAWRQASAGFPRSPAASPRAVPASALQYEPSGRPAPPPRAPQAAGWAQHPSFPPGATPGTAAPAYGDAGFAPTVSARRGGADEAAGGGPPGQVRRPSAGAGGSRLQSRNFRMAVVGGTAAVVLAAAGAIYVGTRADGPQGLTSAGSSSAARPAKPVLAATLTVPGGGAIDTTWMSPDGKLVAASGQGSAIYVWNTADPGHVTTFTAPNMKVGPTIYNPVIDNVAFSADDSSVTASVYPNVPPGAPTPDSRSSYDIYRWNLATGQRTLTWSVTTPSTVVFSNDNGVALTYQDNVVSQVTVSPLDAAPEVTLPGGADQAYRPPYELDAGGGRMIYHPASDETYVWDFATESVIAKLRSSEYTVLSPDGKTILAANPTNDATGSDAPPVLWDVATRSNVTPDDPRWKEQIRLPWQTYSWSTYSPDGSVIATERAGGKVDLWSTATRKYLLTVTDPDYREDRDIVGPGGSAVLMLTAEKTLNGENEYRQISVWETPLAP